MPMDEEPIVGAVYEGEDGRTFEVVSFDENLGTIEIQYADGSLDEIDLDTWYGLELTRLDDEEEDLEEEDYEDYDEDDEDLDADYEDDEDDYYRDR
jgi:hypothetical protein